MLHVSTHFQRRCFAGHEKVTTFKKGLALFLVFIVFHVVATKTVLAQKLAVFPHLDIFMGRKGNLPIIAVGPESCLE